ncbi:MAG: diguanylate cyclase, partial [Lachnospiraceae bacterium]|nr:diguanylate cyclase [Lachnospiraceae bacterium]
MQDILVSPILLLIIAALSVLLFIILLFRHKNASKMNADLKEQNKRLKAIGNVYYSMHIVNLHEDTIQEVSAPEPIRKYAVLNGITPGASDVLKYAISKLIVKDQVKRALEFTDLTTLMGRMNNVDTLADEFKTNEAGWLRFRFMVTDRDAKGLTSDVIMVTAVVDKEKTKEEGLIKISLTDELTGAGNRRAYEEKIAELEKDIPANLVIASLDLNGLKVVNDNKGHDAGDEMIVGAVDCIKKVFSNY